MDHKWEDLSPPHPTSEGVKGLVNNNYITFEMLPQLKVLLLLQVMALLSQFPLFKVLLLPHFWVL